MDNEKMFYNAVAVALEGNPQAMRKIQQKLQKQNSGVFPGWEATYEYLADENAPDPILEWENLEQLGIRLVFQQEDGFPTLLREIHHPPLALYIRQDSFQRELPPWNDEWLSITIVGTRRATPDGKEITRRFARELAENGIAVVSGLALGIDAEAHEGCLEASELSGSASGSPDSHAGKTIAVLARGADRIYPAENQRLGWRILESGGTIISEYPPGEPPYPNRFLERNRIVSGLSRGVLVIECPSRSGSLATASYAREQNRDLFVVPGSIAHPNFFGSHQLIRQGAELVTTPEDILEAYGLDKKDRGARKESSATPEENQVLLALHAAAVPLDVDKIIEMTKLEPRIVNQTLSFLILKELAKETESGYIIE